jgi:hypothetical protein
MRAITVATGSGSAMPEGFTPAGSSPNRGSRANLSAGQTLNLDAQKRATAKMWRRLRGVPEEVRNVVYALFRADPHNKRGHLLGQFPKVAVACARQQAPLSDVFAPVDQFRAELKRTHYSENLPSLSEVEQLEADAECRLKKAELRFEQQPKDIAAQEEFREAVIEEKYAAELMADVFDVDIIEMGVVS